MQYEKQRYFDVSKTITVDKAQDVSLVLQPRFGWITVETSPPGLRIDIDGQDFGASPVRRKELGPGRTACALTTGVINRSRNVFH